MYINVKSVETVHLHVSFSSMYLRTLANSEEPDEMAHKAAFH